MHTNIQLQSQGTYVAVKFSQQSAQHITQFCCDNCIPNAVNLHDLHSTIIYSRKECCGFKAKGKLDNKIYAEPLHFEVWPTPMKAKALVLLIDCNQLIQRHHQIMRAYNATFDYDVYQPHITFSYNLDDRPLVDIPEYEHPLEIAVEYDEPLNIGWSLQ